MLLEKIRYIVAECAARSDGCGPVFELSSSERAKLLVVTVAINGVLEYETLFVSIWGSPDAKDWGKAPVASFSPRSYCGSYSLLLNLAARPNIKYIRAVWRMQPWKSRTKETMFDFYVAVELSGSRIRHHMQEGGARSRLPVEHSNGGDRYDAQSLSHDPPHKRLQS